MFLDLVTEASRKRLSSNRDLGIIKCLGLGSYNVIASRENILSL